MAARAAPMRRRTITVSKMCKRAPGEGPIGSVVRWVKAVASRPPKHYNFQRHAEGPMLRIAMISTPFIPVPPRDYGGTELVVYQLVEGLVQRGHEVTLFATGDSHTSAEL